MTSDEKSGLIYFWTLNRQRADEVAASLTPPGKVIEGENGGFRIDRIPELKRTVS